MLIDVPRPSADNEVIVNSKWVNHNLPQAILAFVAVGHSHSHTAHLLDGTSIHIAEAHEDFLETYGLSKHQVPLLSFSASHWDEPFTEI